MRNKIPFDPIDQEMQHVDELHTTFSELGLRMKYRDRQAQNLKAWGVTISHGPAQPVQDISDMINKFYSLLCAMRKERRAHQNEKRKLLAEINRLKALRFNVVNRERGDGR